MKKDIPTSPRPVIIITPEDRRRTAFVANLKFMTIVNNYQKYGHCGSIKQKQSAE